MNPFAELSVGAQIALAVSVVVIVGAVFLAMLAAEEAPTRDVDDDVWDSVDRVSPTGEEIDPAERHWVKRGPAGGR